MFILVTDIPMAMANTVTDMVNTDTVDMAMANMVMENTGTASTDMVKRRNSNKRMQR